MMKEDRRNWVPKKWFFLRPRNSMFVMSGFLFGTAFLLSMILMAQLGLADNLQNITITTLKDFVIRQNQTDNTYTLDLLFFGNNFNNITQPFKFKITNSTSNISYKVSTLCGSSYTVWTLNNSFIGKHFFQCVFSVTQNLSIGKYNLTMEANDTFNNSYSPYVEFVVTPEATFETFELPYSTESILSYFDSKVMTNTSLFFKSRSFVSSQRISIALYKENPNIPAYDPFNTSQFVEIVPGWTSAEFYLGKALEWAEIRIHYADKQIQDKGLQESTLKLQSYNESTQKWEACSGSASNETANYVFCNTTHFSTWSITGDPITTPSPAPAPASGGSGGGGSGAATPAPTSTAPAKETKTETVTAPAQTQTLPPEIRTTAVAPTNIPLLEGKQELIQAISPQDLGVQEIDVEKINIVQTGNAETIFTTSQDSLDAIAKISGLEENTKQILDEIKNQISAEQVQSVSVQASLQVFEVKSQETGKTAFVSKVSMSFTAEENLESVNILQVIPKSVAQSIAEVTFSGEQPAVLQTDPVVQWSFESVAKGETKDISYTVKKKVESLDATTVAVAKQQQAAEEQPMYDYATIALIIVAVIAAVALAAFVIRRK